MATESSPLTTHVLDTASGLPAQGLCLRLSRLEAPCQQWMELRTSYTNLDGRCPGLLTPSQIKPGTYKLFFDTERYWKERGQESFYPYVEPAWHLTSCCLEDPGAIAGRTHHLQCLQEPSLLLTGGFHYYKGDPEVPRTSAAEPMVLHHLPGELK
ncbi:5-hydroxyisourate hydrolase isoform X2 [Mus musculus]|nr:5-hydroxyisourate hydrolase isoform X2 [Mus musculus]XP_036009450.1 5-hydroxyisourate hydrolase isoform X2 [Mus musculus]